FTRLCVPSLLRHSRMPVEFIFIDLGSLDGTGEYLDGVAAAAPARVVVGRAAAESAFQAACTGALSRAGGQFVVWLSNDTTVTERWLERLVAGAPGDPTIGVVGPMSNYAPEPQYVGSVPYRLGPKTNGTAGRNGQASHYFVDSEPVDRFASEWRERHRSQCLE